RPASPGGTASPGSPPPPPTCCASGTAAAPTTWTCAASCWPCSAKSSAPAPPSTPPRSGSRRWRRFDRTAMLPRTLEPEVMDSAAEARDYDAMDHREVNRVCVADFVAAWGGGGAVLDVGTGTAQIPIELCRQHPGVRVTAIDMAGHMLEVARDNLRRAGLEGRIALEQCDAKRLPFGDGTFAAVMSN